MKKLLIVITTIFSIFFLTACEKSVNINLEVTEKNPMFTEIKIKLKWDEAQTKVLTNSFHAIATDSIGDSVIQETVKNDTEFELRNLKRDTEYNISIYATAKTKKVKLIEFKVSTLKLGSNEENPYIIRNKEDLLSIKNIIADTKSSTIEVNRLLQSYFLLENDIDFNMDTLDGPIFGSKYFKGTFDGNDKTVKNLIIQNKNSSYTSFLGRISGTIQDIHFSNIVIDNMDANYVSTNYIGVVASQTDSTSKLSNIVVENSKILQKHSSSYSQLYAGFITGQARGLHNDLTVTNSQIVVNNENTSDRLPSSGIYIGSIMGSYDDSNKNITARLNKFSATNVDIDFSFGYKEDNDENQYVIYIGGLIGNVASGGNQRDFYYEGNIHVTQRSYTKTDKDEKKSSLVLNVGGITGVIDSPLSNVYSDAIILIEKSDNTSLKGARMINIGLISGRNFTIERAVAEGSITLNAETMENGYSVELVEKIQSRQKVFGYKTVILKINGEISQTKASMLNDKEAVILEFEKSTTNKALLEWILKRIK